MIKKVFDQDTLDNGLKNADKAILIHINVIPVYVTEISYGQKIKENIETCTLSLTNMIPLSKTQ